MPVVSTKLGYPEFADPTMHSQLSDVSVYDISAQRWFQQTATWDGPPWRYAGCSVIVSAPDKKKSFYLRLWWLE